MVYDKDSDSLVEKEVNIKKFYKGYFDDIKNEDTREPFKVTEAISVCDSCVKKIDCSLLRELGNYPYVDYCDDHKEKDGSDKDGDFESLHISDDSTKMIIDDFTRQIGDITNIAFSKLDKLLKK